MNSTLGNFLKNILCNFVWFILPDFSSPFWFDRLVAELLRDVDPVCEFPLLDAVKTFLPSTLLCVVELLPFTALLILTIVRGYKKEIYFRLFLR